MIKYTAVLSLFLILFQHAFGQSGWRDGEMEVSTPIRDELSARRLQVLKLDGEYYADHAILYVVPAELKKLEMAGIPFRITVDDMNRHYAGFWDNRDAYHNYQQIINLADSLKNNFPAICTKVSYGYSIQDRQLVALKISDNVLTDEPEAEVMFDGGIHGDEIIGPEIVIRFARELCVEYGQDPYITDLIDTREIWLYLMVNPDGRVNMTRENANGVDINRDWGYMWDAWGGSSGPYSQVETQALRSCVFDNQFVIHTTYHAGTEYVSYPWSYRSQSAPDESHIEYLASLYATTSLYPNLPYGQGNTGMYAINGSTKDGNYGSTGSVSWSMEISIDKQPVASQIMLYYDRNKPAMLSMIEQAGYGVEGTVTDALTGDPVAAIITIDDYFQAYSDPAVGDFHKYLLPGTYTLKVRANGYETLTLNDIIIYQETSTVVDVQLQPSPGHFVYKVVSCQIPGNNEADEGYTPAVFGTPDNVNYSIGKNGWILLDMQEPVNDRPGEDFIVFEGDDSPEKYSCFAGSGINGPWTFLAQGEGTTGFDLAAGQVAEARYIRIVDDGDGVAQTSNAGFDLDAIQVMDPIQGVYLVVNGIQLDDSQGNNNGRIDAGETCSLGVTIRNNGNEVASNTTVTISTASPFITFDPLTFAMGDLAGGESGMVTSLATSNELTPAGYVMHGTLTLTANDGGYSNGFSLTLPVGEIAETWESGDFSQFGWEYTTPSHWNITDGDSYEGIYSARSGAINDNQTTGLALAMEVISNGSISFYKKVSSEAGYDFLEFYMDGALQQKWSGEEGWTMVSFPVGEGIHTFEWVYSKDIYTAGGNDCAWIDYIVLPPHALDGSAYTGIVTDCSSVIGLSEVILTFTQMETGDAHSVITGPDGSYSASLDVGSIGVTAETEGYEVYRDTLVVYGNESIIYDLCLIGAISIDDDPGDGFSPIQCYPNPFTSGISILLTEYPAESVTIELYDMNGKRIRSWGPANENGNALFLWNGDDEHGNRMPSGMYVYHVRIGGDHYSGKIIYNGN